MTHIHQFSLVGFPTHSGNQIQSSKSEFLDPFSCSLLSSLQFPYYPKGITVRFLDWQIYITSISRWDIIAVSQIHWFLSRTQSCWPGLFFFFKPPLLQETPSEQLCIRFVPYFQGLLQHAKNGTIS